MGGSSFLLLSSASSSVFVGFVGFVSFVGFVGFVVVNFVVNVVFVVVFRLTIFRHRGVVFVIAGVDYV